MDLKQIQFRIIQTGYKDITVKEKDNSEIYYDDILSNKYNYLVVMSHNPEFQHDETFIEAYKNRWNRNETFYENDIKNEMAYDHIRNEVLRMLTRKFPAFDDFRRNIRSPNPMIVAENIFMSLLVFDSPDDEMEKVMQTMENMVEMLNNFYTKNGFSFQLDEKIDTVDENNEVILSDTEFKEIVVVNNLLF
tara:strand:- start:6245 stop:6817 length:573 start_codon:yes stop_codon:yes gene_type:complete